MLSVNEIHSQKGCTFNISCYQSKYPKDFKVNAALVGPGMEYNNYNISCNGTTSEGTEIVYEGLSCKTSYTISFYWKSSIGIKTLDVCFLSETECTPLCEGINLKKMIGCILQ